MPKIDWSKCDRASAREAEAKKTEARKLLADTDWMVTRKAETGRAIRPDILAARVAARALLGSE